MGFEAFNDGREVIFPNSACIPRPNSEGFASATRRHAALDALEASVLFGFTVARWATCPYSAVRSPGVACALPLLFYLDLLGLDLFRCEVGKVLLEVFKDGLHFCGAAGSVYKHGSLVEDSSSADLELDFVLFVFGEEAFEGLVKRVCFGVALAHGPWLRRSRVNFAGGFVPDLALVFVGLHLFAPCKHGTSCFCCSLRRRVDFEKDDIGAGFWYDSGGDLGNKGFREDFDDLL